VCVCLCVCVRVCVCVSYLTVVVHFAAVRMADQNYRINAPT
jgi:hypothetical protein